MFILVTMENCGSCNNGKEILALLGCCAAQTGSYRRFGTTYRSHLKGSSSLNSWTLDR